MGKQGRKAERLCRVRGSLHSEVDRVPQRRNGLVRRGTGRQMEQPVFRDRDAEPAPRTNRAGLLAGGELSEPVVDVAETDQTRAPGQNGRAAAKAFSRSSRTDGQPTD